MLELADREPQVQELIRQAREGRDQEADLLAIKGVLRKERVFREATLMLFRDGNGDLQAAPIIDGKLSTEHEAALANPAVRSQLRLRSELRRGRRFDQLLPQALRGLQDSENERAARDLRTRAYASELHGEESADADRQTAVAALAALPVRRVGPEEHRGLMRSSQSRPNERSRSRPRRSRKPQSPVTCWTRFANSSIREAR